jgi:hypothetical protein
LDFIVIFFGGGNAEVPTNDSHDSVSDLYESAYPEELRRAEGALLTWRPGRNDGSARPQTASLGDGRAMPQNSGGSRALQVNAIIASPSQERRREILQR